MPLHMRLDLIKELHESLEFSHVSAKEIVRRLVIAFTIP